MLECGLAFARIYRVKVQIQPVTGFCLEHFHPEIDRKAFSASLQKFAKELNNKKRSSFG